MEDLNLEALANKASEMLSVRGKRALVVGLGRFGGGVGVTRWLSQNGAEVIVTDLADADSLRDSVQQLSDLDITFHLGGHDEADLEIVDFVVVNPAVVKRKSTFFQVIEQKGIPWTTEMNLFGQRVRANVIGVTGTYGKSTTCSMLHRVLDAWTATGNGRWTKAYLGGNIGRSLLPDLPAMRPSDVVVLEMSNAQLEDLSRIEWRPDLAVITNLHPNHLDRHGGWKAYLAAKFNLVASENAATPIFLGKSLSKEALRIAQKVAPNLADRVCPFDSPNPALVLNVPGAHNRQNANLVYAVACHCGVPEGVTRSALATFRGLPHRLELVGVVAGVKYVNDSKSTSPDATLTALDCFSEPVIAIVGGIERDHPLESFAHNMVRRCKAVICTGQSGPRFARVLRESLSGEACFVEMASNLEAAVSVASVHAFRGDVVLYAPGAPSFDSYANYEKRGEHFTKLVRALID